MTHRPLRVLITGGGTKVKIDDVRHLGNFATGRFPTAIGKAFVQAGVNVILLGSEDLVERIQTLGQENNFSALVPFRWFEDLERELFHLIQVWRPDIILMAAAVSDWICKDVHEGKIDSSEESLTLTFTRAPKLLSRLREAAGDDTFITGFKLLSGASHDELMGKAMAQVVVNQLSLTVANDLSQIKDGRHPVTLVTPWGGQIRLKGARERVAAQIVDFILHRHRQSAAVRLTAPTYFPVAWPGFQVDLQAVA